MSAKSLYSAGRSQIDRDDQTLVRALQDRGERVFKRARRVVEWQDAALGAQGRN